MNINLITVDGGTTWRRGGMPRLTRTIRPNGYQIVQLSTTTMFQYPIPAGDPWIGQTVMFRFHISLSDLAWSPAISGYINVAGPISGIGGQAQNPGQRVTMMEWTPGSAFPGGSTTRRSHVTGTLVGTITGAGTLNVNVKLKNNSSIRNSNDEQSVCVMMLVG